MLTGGALVIPSPPKESSGGAPFECPYCFVIISVDGIPAWHKHFFHDLQPYVCTVAACSTPHTLFSTRHEWVQHLKEAHPREWTGDENRVGAEINELDKSNFCTICPLCKSASKSEKHFVRHLARHLQELALFVLPQDNIDSDTDDGPDPELLGKSSSENSVSSTFSTSPEHEKSHDEKQVHDELLWQDVTDTFGTEPRIFEQEGELDNSDPDPRDDRRIAPDRELPEASRHPRPRLNEFFVDGTGLHREVMQREICNFLGPRAYCKPHSYDV